MILSRHRLIDAPLYPFTGVRPCLSVNCQSKADVHLAPDVTLPAVLAVNAESWVYTAVYY